MDENGNGLIVTIENKIESQMRKEKCDKEISEIVNVFENES